MTPAQSIFKGYVINYDESAAVVLGNGRELANFATNDQVTAHVQAQRWCKARGQCLLETDKGVFDPEQRDKYGNLVKVADAPAPVDEPTDIDDLSANDAEDTQ